MPAREKVPARRKACMEISRWSKITFLTWNLTVSSLLLPRCPVSVLGKSSSLTKPPVFTVKDRQHKDKFAIQTELQLAEALSRRALACDVMQLCSYSTMDRWHSTWSGCLRVHIRQAIASLKRQSTVHRSTCGMWDFKSSNQGFVVNSLAAEALPRHEQRSCSTPSMTARKTEWNNWLQGG